MTEFTYLGFHASMRMCYTCTRIWRSKQFAISMYAIILRALESSAYLWVFRVFWACKCMKRQTRAQRGDLCEDLFFWPYDESCCKAWLDTYNFRSMETLAAGNRKQTHRLRQTNSCHEAKTRCRLKRLLWCIKRQRAGWLLFRYIRSQQFLIFEARWKTVM